MKNKNIQTEIDASYLYQKLSDNETDETIKYVFRQMSEIEKGHAEAFAKKENINGVLVGGASLIPVDFIEIIEAFNS